MQSFSNTTSDSLETIFKRYFSLTKPKIILLLSVTGVVAYLIPNPSDLSFLNIILFIFIGYASAGGAMAINNYIDRDIDVLMVRTKDRASIDLIKPAWKVVIFGFVLASIGILTAYYVFNLLTAVLLIWADLFYIFGYSIFLKRRSQLSTIIGGVISPTPVFVGYAAALGYIPLKGWLLGAIVFIWTPSHTWAMSSRNYDDYLKANIPMLPVKYGMKNTALATLIGGMITIFYGLFVYIKFYYPPEPLIQMIIIALVSFYFIYTLLRFYILPNVRNATICFRRGHTIWLTTIFMVVLIQNYI